MPDESIFNIIKELFLPKYGKCRGLGCAFRPIRLDDSRRVLDVWNLWAVLGRNACFRAEDHYPESPSNVCGSFAKQSTRTKPFLPVTSIWQDKLRGYLLGEPIGSSKKGPP